MSLQRLWCWVERRPGPRQRRPALVSLALVTAVAVSATLTLASAPTWAASDIKRTAKQMSDRAAKHFAEKEFRAAAELFEKAYALDGDKVIRLRNAGRAYEEAGEAKLALHCFKRYEALEKNDKLLADARTRIRRLQATIATEAKASALGGRPPAAEGTPASPGEARAAPSSATPPAGSVADAKSAPGGAGPGATPATSAGSVSAEAAPSRRPRWLLPVGVAGLGAVVGGVSTLVRAGTAASTVDTAVAKGDYGYDGGPDKLSADRSAIKTNRIVGWSLVGVGVVGAGAAVWGALTARSGQASSAGLLVAPIGPADGPGLCAALRF